MTDRPILRFPNPKPTKKFTGSQRNIPQSQSPGYSSQGRRFKSKFDRLKKAFDSANPEVVLRDDPRGIAPERALVFVTAGSVKNFAKAAEEIELEVFAESELEALDEYPEGFKPAGKSKKLSCTLYTTMPTLESFRKILKLWGDYKKGKKAPYGKTPWWNAFDLLLDIRPWGPEDRLSEDARAIIEDRLPNNDEDKITLELEIWPIAEKRKRTAWRKEIENYIATLNGQILDSSSISTDGFAYEALLASLTVTAVRSLLDNPGHAQGLATLEGIQFILPHTIAQAPIGDLNPETEEHHQLDNFNPDALFRVALLDGTPIAAHPALDGGIIIEDLHDIVQNSTIDKREHATAMASLILRGDLKADGTSLQDTRLISVPLLIDSSNGARTPENRLFVDLLHSTLTQLFASESPLGPDVFVINFSIGDPDSRFAGRISSMARLIDWWSAKYGILFVISAGNIMDGLDLSNITSTAFEDATDELRHKTVKSAIRESNYNRTLLAPAEALNGISVGAISQDISENTPPTQAGIKTLGNADDVLPQITSALGLGPLRAVKPDLIAIGGREEVRANPNGDHSILRAVVPSQRTGLYVAAPSDTASQTKKTRGTSAAAALTTRSILKSAEALTGEDGPYEGQELPRQDLALLTRALAVNSARWPNTAYQLYEEEKGRLGQYQHLRAKEEVARRFGYGELNPLNMQQSPDMGVTLVGLGTLRKDQGHIFRLPLPPSLSGDRVPRAMRTTISWFTQINTARSQYRLAGFEAIACDDLDNQNDKCWGLDFKSDELGNQMIKRGSVWSRRLINKNKTTPTFDQGTEIPIRVQCRDTAQGALSPDDDIRYAIACTLEIEADVQYDIFQEIENEIRLKLRRRA